MLFKFRISRTLLNLALGALLSAGGLVACTGSLTPTGDDYLIGNSVQDLSSLKNDGGEDVHTLVMFDETVHRIHKFDLSTMTHQKSYEVNQPSEKHYVLYNAQTDSIVDLTDKGMSLIDRFDRTQNNPLSLQGTPRSAAFNQDLGILVIYDDLMSVGILQLDANGDAQKSWVGGPALLEGASIASGDLTSDGKLVLALSDNSIVLVDVTQTLAQKTWVFTRFTTSLQDIKWLAPVGGHPEQVFVRDADGLALLDLNTQGVLAQYSLADEYVQKLSKLGDAHVILRSNDGLTVKLLYPQSSQIKVRTLYRQADYFLSSLLSLQKDRWSFVDSTYQSVGLYDDLNQVKKSRNFKQYRVSDLLSLQKRPVASEAQIQMSDQYLFALFPSELGYAVRYDVGSDHQSELKLFNLNYIPRH